MSRESPRKLRGLFIIFRLAGDCPQKSCANFESGAMNKAIRQLARLSFGVYLVHPLVISCLVRIRDFSASPGPFLLFGAAVAVSVAVTVLLRRTSLVRYL
jgi:peptidoglycan/LPS O-acetylase OafA/YrhL